MGNQNASSNYFTLVYYPLEFKEEHLFWNLGTVFESPVHNSKQDLHPCKQSVMIFWDGVGYEQFNERQGKPHVHVLIKTPNKMTENSFIEKLCKVIKNDFTGIALHKGMLS